MRPLWQPLVGIALVAAVSSGLTLLALGPHGEPAEHAGEPAAEDENESGISSEKSRAGDVVLTLTDAAFERLAIETEPLRGVTQTRRVSAFGRLVEDPAEAFVLRAPLAGTLRRGGDAWPAVGATVRSGTIVAQLEPRVTPTERIDLLTRLSAAQGEQSEAEASVSAARSSYEQKRKLNDENHIVSDRSLEEAESRFKAEAARLERTKETVNLIEHALTAQGGPSAPTTLSAPRDGVIVDIAAQPDEAVEAGQIIARVASYESLLARVALAPGDEVDTQSSDALLQVAGGDKSLPAVLSGVVAAADGSAAPVALLKIENTERALRPGRPVTAWLAAPGAPRKGVDVPRAAVVRTGGRAWVYVAQDDRVFTRLAIPVDSPTPGGWFVASDDLRVDDEVVIVGADGLLSEELKHEIEQEEHAAGE